MSKAISVKGRPKWRVSVKVLAARRGERVDAMTERMQRILQMRSRRHSGQFYAGCEHAVHSDGHRPSYVVSWSLAITYQWIFRVTARLRDQDRSISRFFDIVASRCARKRIEVFECRRPCGVSRLARAPLRLPRSECWNLTRDVRQHVVVQDSQAHRVRVTDIQQERRIQRSARHWTSTGGTQNVAKPGRRKYQVCPPRQPSCAARFSCPQLDRHSAQGLGNLPGSESEHPGRRRLALQCPDTLHTTYLVLTFLCCASL